VRCCLQGMLWQVGDLEGMLRSPAARGELDEVALRCAAVQLSCTACVGGSGGAGGEELADGGSPVGGATRSVSISSSNGAVKVRHVVCGILELVRDIPGSDEWVFDGMCKCSPAGMHPVVYDVSFIR